MPIFLRRLVWMSAILLTACQTLSESESEKKLYNILKAYEDVVRWGSLGKIYALTRPEPGETVKVPSGLENVRVTNYDILSGPSKLAEDEWTQTIAIEYVLTDRQVVKALIDTQLWRLDTERGSWYRANPIPPFR